MKKQKCKICDKKYPLDIFRQRQKKYKIYRIGICKECELKND
tara:strand:- start:379 stop:504 length:126 start_codon:yes stop_codon:yes gene_type:complete